jgi:hypothetical protein
MDELLLLSSFEFIASLRGVVESAFTAGDRELETHQYAALALCP